MTKQSVKAWKPYLYYVFNKNKAWKKRGKAWKQKNPTFL